MGVPRFLSASEGASVSLEKKHPYVALDGVSSMSLIRGWPDRFDLRGISAGKQSPPLTAAAGSFPSL